MLQMDWIKDGLTSYFTLQDRTFPPLHSFLLIGWVAFFGAAPVSTAMLSFLFSMAAAIALYRLGSEMFDRTVAVIAVAMFWTSAANLMYATETRMYSLLLAASLWSAYGLHRWLWSGGTSGWWLYIVASVVGVYTHYSFWFLLYAWNLAVAVWWWRGAVPHGQARRWVWAQVAVVGSYLPWLGFFIPWVVSFYFQHQRNWVQALYPVDHWTYPLVALAGYVVPAWSTPAWANGLWFTVVGGCLIAVAVGMRRCADPAVGLRWHRSCALLGFAIVIPLALVVVFNIGVPRYVVYIGPFFCLLFAAALVTLDRRLGWRALLAPSILLLVSAWNLWYQVYPSSVGWWSRVDPSVAEEFWVDQPVR